jgi:mannose-6-phosphate isomerase-like protein (cupin superfamily)
MSDWFEDERGAIKDLLGPIDAVTWITTKKGAVRGNHVHRETDQWTYVVSGRLLAVCGVQQREVGPNRMVAEPRGIPHAWKALENTVCLVFTKGPRSGEGYESDTIRLDSPLLT